MVIESSAKRPKGYDPITLTRNNSPSLTRAFLRDGDTLRPIQRAGVIVIAFMILGWGVYFAADALEAIHGGSPRYLLFGGPSLFLIVIGLLGVVNALRRKRRKSRD
jgi:hypothetical protein